MSDKTFKIVNGDMSDGYHTFDELYEHRITLFIALCKKIQDFKYHGDARNIAGDEKIVWKSTKHHDGSEYDGWFIMGIGIDQGEQISYHLPMSKWDMTDFAEYRKRAPKWDGHTSDDVLKRIDSL